MKRKFLYLFLCVAVFVTLLTLPVFADATASGTCGVNLTWALSDDGTLTISGTGAMIDYEEESAPWYESSELIKTVVLTEGVTSIGDYAFYGCTFMSELMLPETLKYIGDYAFAATTFASITLPSELTYLGKGAFYYSRIANVVIPEGVTEIGDSAFSNCSHLVSVSMPTSVTSIGESAFAGCTSLTSVVIPDCVTSIGRGAFSGCTGLPKVTFPSSVSNIGQMAFYNCTSLADITFEHTVTEELVLGSSCFHTSSSTATTIRVNDMFPVAIAEENWSSNNRTITYKLIDSGKTITVGGDAGEYNAPLAWTLTSDGVFTIFGSGAMYEYGLGGFTWYSYRNSIKTVVIAEGVTSIAEYAFENYNNITNVVIGKDVTSIGYGAFFDCDKLSSVHIPNGVELIGNFAFYYCALTDIVIPASVTSIGNGAFEECMNLVNITFEHTSSDKLAISETSFHLYNYHYDHNNQDLVTTINVVRKGDIHAAISGYDWSDSQRAVSFAQIGGDAIIDPTIATQNSAATITAPADGWVEGTNTFTVAADDACVVAVSYDGGETYTRLTATAVDGGYSFTADNMTADTTVAVVQAGDASGDGVVDGVDQAQTKAMALGKLSVSALNQAVLDVNKDGTVDGIDAAQLKAAVLGKLTLAW